MGDVAHALVRQMIFGALVCPQGSGERRPVSRAGEVRRVVVVEVGVEAWRDLVMVVVRRSY